MSNTSCIITMVRNEHDFINAWIEHHINVGFTHFYILIDNLGEIKQPEYIIEESFKKYVTFINCTNEDVVTYFNNTLDNCLKCGQSIAGILHKLLNDKIILKNIILEEWTIAIGVDQYMYFNGSTIQKYLLDIDDSCTQIISPWSICVLNLKDWKYSNFLENMDEYYKYYGKMDGHSNGLIRTSNLKSIHSNSHFNESITPTQKIYVIDEYFEKDSSLNTWEIFNIVNQKLQYTSFNDLKLGSIHIMARNINELFIKSYFNWNFCRNSNIFNNNIEQFINAIKKNNKSIPKLIRESVIDVNYNILKLNLKFVPLKCVNTTTYYDNIIMEQLVKYNITKEQFDNWKKTHFINK